MRKVEIPDNCPNCDSKLERVTNQLFCRNSECSAVAFKKIQHFAKTMKIKGLGEKTIEKLELEDILDIYLLTDIELNTILGQKLGSKLYQEIENSKHVDFVTYLSAFAIPLIGRETASKLALVVGSLEEVSKESCIKAGLGEKATINLVDWIEKDYTKYKNLPINLSKSESQTNDIVVCISGKLTSFRTKKEAEDWLDNYNIKVVSGVSKKVNYLIKEDTKPSSKQDLAEKYGIPVITFDNFKEIVNVST